MSKTVTSFCQSNEFCYYKYFHGIVKIYHLQPKTNCKRGYNQPNLHFTKVLFFTYFESFFSTYIFFFDEWFPIVKVFFKYFLLAVECLRSLFATRNCINFGITSVLTHRLGNARFNLNFLMTKSNFLKFRINFITLFHIG